MRRLIYLVLCISFKFVESVCCASTLEFQWRNPLPNGHTLSSAAYGNGLFVAVGGENAVMTSPDGALWTAQQVQPPDYKRDFTTVIFENNMFVVGGNGIFAMSTNGVNWVFTTVPGSVHDITYGNGKFVAAGSGIWTSENGTEWNLRTNFGITLESIAFADGKFVAIGNEHFGNGASLVSSLDGLQWTKRNSGIPTSVIQRISYGNGVFLAGCLEGLFRSTDATNWTKPSLPGGPFSTFRGTLDFQQNRFLLPLSNRLYYSTNGLNWTFDTVPAISFVEIDGVACGPAPLMIAVGDGGCILQKTVNGTWVKRSNGFLNDLYTITTGGSNLVAAGANGFVAVSTNGHQWQTNDLGYYCYFVSSAFGNGKYVLAGMSNQNPVVAVSTNAVNWKVSQALPGTQGGFEKIAFGNGIFVALGLDALQNPIMFKSVNASNWTSITPAPNLSDEIAFGNGIFVIAEENGSLLISTNGTIWSSRNFGGGESFLSCSFANGAFWLADFDRVWKFKTNTLQLLTTDSSFLMGKFLFGNGRYLSLSSDVNSSIDEVNWTSSELYNRYYDCIFALGSFWLIGNYGAILQGTEHTSLLNPALTGSNFHFTSDLSDALDTSGIQTSTNLIDWTPVSLQVSGTSGAWELTDTNAGGGARRFYRLKKN